MQRVRSTILVTHIRRDNLLRSQACMKPRSVLAWPLKKGPHLMPSPSVFEQLFFLGNHIDHHCTKLITVIHFKLKQLNSHTKLITGPTPTSLKQIN